MTIPLDVLLRDSAYKLDQFKPAQINALQASITMKDAGKKPAPYVTCLVRGKPIKLTPEEAIRQLYIMVLRDDLGYPVKRMQVEHEVTFGREKKRADICVFDKDKTEAPYILVEIKKPKLKDGKEQLKSYCHATGAPMGVWTNGQQISHYHRKDPNYFEDTRTRRGRLYEAQPGQGQPNQQRVGPHPYEDPMMRAVGREGRVAKTMYTYTACNPLLNMPNQGQGLTLALGSRRAWSAWRIIQTEVSASGCVLVTLKALSAFAILPEIDYGRIAQAHQAAVRGAVQRVLDSAFRESPTSVVDHCRAALTVLLSRWLVQKGHDQGVLGKDLSELAKKIDAAPYDMTCPSRVAQVIAKMHVRGKPNEQQRLGLRQPVDGDDEFALAAVGLVLRDLGWAS